MLYAGSTPLVCFVETLARFRSAGSQLARDLSEIVHSDPDHVPPATVPGSWLAKRQIGTVRISSARFVNVYSSEWLSHLRRLLEPDLVRSGQVEAANAAFDLSVLMSQNRSITQRVATHVHALGYSGVYYQSRHGSDLFNWAVFEPFNIIEPSGSALDADDSSFREALRHLDLTFAPSL